MTDEGGRASNEHGQDTAGADQSIIGSPIGGETGAQTYTCTGKRINNATLVLFVGSFLARDPNWLVPLRPYFLPRNGGYQLSAYSTCTVRNEFMVFDGRAEW